MGAITMPTSRRIAVQRFVPVRSFATLLFFLMVPLQASEVISADLQPQTVEAFNRYVKATEARINQELARPGGFLYVEELAEPQRSQVLASLKSGNIYMEQLHTRDSSGKEMTAPDGLIHHWMGAVFIPCVTLQQTLELVEDYNNHQDIYKPEVVRSRLIERRGNDFKIYYRLRKKKVITVILNTDHDVHYFPVDSTHCYSRSYSTRIAQVANADTPQEYEKPVGHDGGFLWRLYSYWRFEQKDGGVYVECESISLTRDLPPVIGRFIKPFITEIPKESLQMTMGSTRSALQARFPCGGKK